MVKYPLVLDCRRVQHTRQLLFAPGVCSEINRFDTTAVVIRGRKRKRKVMVATVAN